MYSDEASLSEGSKSPTNQSVPARKSPGCGFPPHLSFLTRTSRLKPEKSIVKRQSEVSENGFVVSLIATIRPMNAAWESMGTPCPIFLGPIDSLT